jgi:CrcB protein
MNMLGLMYVAFGGAFGSMCRYAVGVWIGRINETDFPFATLIINITGSFLMGIWIGVMVLMLPTKSKELHLLMAIGVLGGYTTFSTFSLESYLLIEKGLWLQAAAYMIGSVVLSIAALFAGMWLLRSING